MSRIQDILAKAERDGTARRTQTTGTLSSPPVPPAFTPPSVGRAATGPGRAERVEARVDGTSALDTPAFQPAAFEAPPFGAAAVAPPAAQPSAVPAAIEDARTAAAMLHPLLIAAIAPHAEGAERYRTLRARISHREETMPVRTIMVTSPGSGEGKSVTAANLALTMAQEFQKRVVLVDADLRGSSVHTLFGLEGAPGLAEVLSGEATLDEVMIYLPDYRLTVVPAGRTPQFPTELLGSSAMRRAVDTLRSRFDRLLLDVPAVMPLADAGTLAPAADGVLMVVRAGVTQRPALDQALAAFDEQKVLGVVLNAI